MHTITEEKYNELSKDYRGIWDSDEFHGDTNFNGRRTLLHWEEGVGTCLLIEGESLTITQELLNPNTLFVVYNEEKYNSTGETEIIEETENLFIAERLVKHNKSLNYSTYPPHTYNPLKK